MRSPPSRYAERVDGAGSCPAGAATGSGRSQPSTRPIASSSPKERTTKIDHPAQPKLAGCVTWIVNIAPPGAINAIAPSEHRQSDRTPYSIIERRTGAFFGKGNCVIILVLTLSSHELLQASFGYLV